LARVISALRRYVRMATMGIIPMPARRTVITALLGSWVVSLLAPARGTTATTDPVSIARTSTPVDGMVPALSRILAMATITTVDMPITLQLRTGRLAAAFAVVPVVSTAACIGN